MASTVVAPEKKAQAVRAPAFDPNAMPHGPTEGAGTVCLKAIFGFWENKKTEFTTMMLAVFIIFAVAYAGSDQAQGGGRSLRGSVFAGPAPSLLRGRAETGPGGDQGN